MRGLGKRVPGAVQLNIFARDFEERIIALPAREQEGGDLALFLDRALHRSGPQWAETRHRYCASYDAKKLLERAIRDGVLPLWSYFEDGPQEIDYLALKAIGWHSIASGVFDAREPGNPLDRAPLWVMREDAERFAQLVIEELYPEARKEQNGAALIKRCEEWLRAEFRAGTQCTRDDFLERARADIGQISERGFRHAWATVAPEFGRDKPGRPRKKSAR